MSINAAIPASLGILIPLTDDEEDDATDEEATAGEETCHHLRYKFWCCCRFIISIRILIYICCTAGSSKSTMN
jgi:hypothetical protein